MTDLLPRRIVLLDIDSLCWDVFQQALSGGHIPHLAGLLGGPDCAHGLQFEMIATAPSITYCCQASSFTGEHPNRHWIPGNLFFDRFGRLNNGKPRRYEFDFTDALAVFASGLAGQALGPGVETLYQTAARCGWESTVAYNMFARGARDWLKPGLDDWRDFIGPSEERFAERYDNAMINDVIEHLRSGHRPDLLTLYFFGLDHETHLHGPAAQARYLAEVVDRQVGRFLDEYSQLGLMPGSLFVVFSDHGQVAIQCDDRHQLQIGPFFDRELGLVFDALGLDVHDHPFEADRCDAMIAPCGSMAHIYLRCAGGGWSEPPRFSEVLKLANTFWVANTSGRYAAELQGTLDMVMVRNVEAEGWEAHYQVYKPEGLSTVEDYLARQPLPVVDAANRLRSLTSPVTGDLLLFTRAEEGYAFMSIPYRGSHGGLHPDESRSVLAYGLPGGSPEQIEHLRGMVRGAIEQRCLAEGCRQVSNADLAYSIRALMGW